MSGHHLLFLDFETYYDNEYSLKKMPPPNYILDPRWEMIGCAAKVDDGLGEFIDGPDFPAFIGRFDPRTTTTVTFNALFDNCILAWRYGFIPARMLCTMRMAVALRGHVLHGASLATVGKCLGVGTKGTTIESVRGMHRAEIMAQPGLWRAFQAYALNDNEMSAGILARLWPEFPVTERRVMDKVIRCAVDPKFQVDVPMLQAHLNDLEAEKVLALDLAADKSLTENERQEFVRELRSNPKFEALLKARGVDIQYKQSLTDPEREIPAFAKTDEFMSDLLEHEDTIVQALAAARLGERSTIEQRRSQRLLSIANLDWSPYRGGKHLLPIPLRYSGAHTHRLSGDWLMNMQNLPSGRTKPSKLRKGLIAPPGHKVVKADKAQIECRLNAFICGQTDLLELFRQGKDAYSVLASAIFGQPVDKTTCDGLYRFIGKGGELGLGFGCGDDKFFNMVVRQARTLGMDVKKLLEIWTPSLATKSVQTYRTTHRNITQAWNTLETMLRSAWLGKTLPVRFGPVLVGHGFVEGPGNLKMQYGNPREDISGELLYDYGKRTHRMYGPKFLENIVQFLARINLMNDALRIGDRTHIDFSLQEHDALAWIVPDAAVEDFKKVVRQEFTRTPSWAPGIPLDCEISSGQSYGG